MRQCPVKSSEEREVDDSVIFSDTQKRPVCYTQQKGNRGGISELGAQNAVDRLGNFPTESHMRQLE